MSPALVCMQTSSSALRERFRTQHIPGVAKVLLPLFAACLCQIVCTSNIQKRTFILPCCLLLIFTSSHGSRPASVLVQGPLPKRPQSGRAQVARRSVLCAAERRFDLVTTDVDGTLLDSKNELSARNEQAIAETIKLGVPVRLCTVAH